MSNESQELQGVTFISEKPSLKLSGVKNAPKGVVQFVNGSFYTEDQVLIKTLRNFIQTKPAVSQLVRELDLAQAAKVVAAFEQKLLRQNQAVKGSMNSAVQQQMLGTDAGKALAMNEAVANNLPPEAGEELADQMKGAMQLTENSQETVQNNDGFIPDPEAVAKQDAESQERDAAVQTLLNVG